MDTEDDEDQFFRQNNLSTKYGLEKESMTINKLLNSKICILLEVLLVFIPVLAPRPDSSCRPQEYRFDQG